MASQITCITKPDQENTREAITAVGGMRAHGVSFYISRQDCADDIRFNRETYFVQVGRYRIDVTAYQRPGGGVWFIKTEPDGTKADNLLSLMACM